jgi:hypothetical protein
VPSKVPDDVRSSVIQQWLKRELRDTIASESGQSGGAVTNIISNWKQGLGIAAAAELRELAVTLKKIGITAVQCAVGFRVATMMNRLGVEEDSFESFMVGTYDRCKNLGLTPEDIASSLADLLEFSKSIPINEIPSYIDKEKQVKKELEEEMAILHEQIGELEAQKSVAHDNLNIALRNENMTSAKLKWYSDIKVELSRHGLRVDEISQMAKVVAGIQQCGFDANKILDEISNLEMLKAEYKGYQGSITILKEQYDALNSWCYYLQQMIFSHNLILSTYEELVAMGLGLRELKQLRQTIGEIAVANNTTANDSVQKFLKDIKEQYDNKLGFEFEIEKLQGEINRLIQEDARLRTQLLILPLVAPSLTGLLQRGVSEQDIVDIAELLKSGGGREISSSSVSIPEIRSLISELRQYGSIKSTIIQLTQKLERLKYQINTLRVEKQDLDAQNRAVTIALLQLKQIASFFSGSSTSLRNELVGLISIITYMIYSLNLGTQQENVQNDINTPTGNDFAPLVIAARGGAGLDLTKLKISLKKAIEVTQKNLAIDDSKLNEKLSEARLALSSEQV